MPTAKILIVDDDRDILRLLAISLERAGYEVLAAADAAQAVELAVTHAPDLSILDMNMPSGSGLDLQAKLRADRNGRALPVIFLTGDKSDSSAADVKRQGASHVLYKPVENAQLLDSVRLALESHQ